MNYKAVEAVFFWGVEKTNFAAAYGREPGGNTYSKDYLQVRQPVQVVMDKVLKRGAQNQMPVTLAWPGSERTDGIWREKNSGTDSRGELAWLKQNGPPQPWRVGNPREQVEVTIPGDPNATSPEDADAVLERIQKDGLKPWLIAVKLYGDPKLHLRAYLENPRAGSEGRGVAKLPRGVKEAMAKTNRKSCGAVQYDRGPVVRAPRLVKRMEEALSRDPNVLLVGPPGTGKTVALEDYESRYKGGRFVGFDPELWEDAWSEEETTRRGKAVSLVFHPSYSYEQFVAGLVPEAGDSFRLKARPGVLLSMAHWTSEPGNDGLLVIDEFNRGPAAAIFGDTLALLDKGKRSTPGEAGSGAAIQRPFPDDDMTVAEEYKTSGGREVDDDVRLPSTLKIVAALNSTDRSVAPLDAALRRRFSVLYVGPDYEVLSNQLGLSEFDSSVVFDPPEEFDDWEDKHVKELAVRLLIALNERIELVIGQDFLLGHALFWDVAGEDAESATETLAHAFNEKVAATLRMTFVDQDEALAAVLNAGEPEGGGNTVARWIEPKGALKLVATPKVHLENVTEMDYQVAIGALLELL